MRDKPPTVALLNWPAHLQAAAILYSLADFSPLLLTMIGLTGGRVIESLMIFGAPALIRTGFGVGMFLTVSCGWNGAAGIMAGPCALNLLALANSAIVNNMCRISVTIIKQM